VSGGVPPEAAYWDGRYAKDGRLWGDGPSELARLTVARLGTGATADLCVLDIGCGYGRDTRYLAAELGCRALGVDPSPAAVQAAQRARRAGLDVEFEVGDAASLATRAEHAEAYDVVFACNVYHLLGPAVRREFVAAVARLARPGGLLFLSTLSPRDPQHYAVGRQVPDEERSWVDRVYLHFCTAEELAGDFAAFQVLDLEERPYVEHNAGGVVHRHASWFLEGRRV